MCCNLPFFSCFAVHSLRAAAMLFNIIFVKEIGALRPVFLDYVLSCDYALTKEKLDCQLNKLMKQQIMKTIPVTYKNKLTISYLQRHHSHQPYQKHLWNYQQYIQNFQMSHQKSHQQSLRKNCPYSELFWFVFSPNVGKYGPE